MKEEFKQQEEELRKKKKAFEEVRDKFNSWRFNMYSCLFLYIVIFIIIQIINNFLIKENIPGWLNVNETLVVIVAAIILGICFIFDSVVTSYLKTPLQRLAMKIDLSPMEDKEKNNLMRVSQAINELLKESLKKFGILVIPSLIYNVIDTKVIRVLDGKRELIVIKENNTRSE